MDLCHTEALKEIGCSALLRIKPLNGLNLDIQEKSLGQGFSVLCGGFKQGKELCDDRVRWGPTSLCPPEAGQVAVSILEFV